MKSRRHYGPILTAVVRGVAILGLPVVGLLVVGGVTLARSEGHPDHSLTPTTKPFAAGGLRAQNSTQVCCLQTPTT